MLLTVKGSAHSMAAMPLSGYYCVVQPNPQTMKRLLTILITGYWNEPKKHEHEWEIIEQAGVHATKADGTLEKDPRYIRYTLRCKTCGDLKVVNGY